MAWKVWRGKHRPTNQSYAVRRVSVLTKALLPFHTAEQRDYTRGRCKPHYPVPAIPLQVVWPDTDGCIGYKDMIYIDTLQYGEDDPYMVCAWDFWKLDPDRIGNYGEYTRVYP